MQSSLWIMCKRILLPLMIFLLSYPISAFAAEINMEFFLGYNNIFQLNKWAPIHIVLENKGRTIHGSLEAVVISGSEYLETVHSTTYSKNVELPKNARKLYSFTIRLYSFIHPVILQLKEGGKIILRRELNLRNYYTTDQLVLVLGDRVSLDFFSIFPEGIKPIYPRAEFLPETWYGYDGVKMVIIHGPTLKKLRERQFLALKEWIQRGGYCIISGSINLSTYLDSRMQELLPVKALGLKRLSELHSLEKFSGERLIVSDPFLILESRPSSGKAILSEGVLPIIVQRDIGLGRVLFLAFDYGMYPFSEWKGRFSLWKKILDLKPGSGDVIRKSDKQNLLSLMITHKSARFTAHVLLLAFMGVYLISVYYLFRLFRKNRWARGRALLVLAASGMVFSILSYGVFFYEYIQRDPFLNGYTHLNLSDKKRVASMKYLLGLFSLRGGNYQIVLDSPKNPISPIAFRVAGKKKTFDFELNEDDRRGHTILLQMDRWSNRFFEMDAKISFPLGGGGFYGSTGSGRLY